jgi:hypothetical protein
MTRGSHARFGRRSRRRNRYRRRPLWTGSVLSLLQPPTGRWHRSRAQRRSGWSAGSGVLGCGGSSASVPGTAYCRASATRLERARWIRVAQLASSRQEPLVSSSWGIAARRSRRAASSPRSDASTGLVLPAGNEVAAKNHRTGRPGREPPLRPAPRCRLSTLQPSIVPRGGRPAGARGPALRCMDPSGSRHRPAQRLNLEAVAAPRQSASRHRIG